MFPVKNGFAGKELQCKDKTKNPSEHHKNFICIKLSLPHKFQYGGFDGGF